MLPSTGIVKVLCRYLQEFPVRGNAELDDLIISMNFNPIKGTAQITICLSSNIHSSTINWTLMDCHHYSEGSFSG